MQILRTIVATLLAISTLMPFSMTVKNNVEPQKESTNSILEKYSLKGAYLIEADTGTELFSMKESETCEIASVTKVMTLLLVMEALEEGRFQLNDIVYVSKNAASMGGSQVFLEEGESITVEELINCAVIASANDASVALAELVSGSEDSFVRKMNEKAEEIGMKDTLFENPHGLDDDTKNVSTAYDMALLARYAYQNEMYQEIYFDTSGYSCICKVTVTSPVETAVDFKVTTYNLFGFGKGKKVIEELYKKQWI